MALLIILIAIGIQRFLQVCSEPYRLNWMGEYYQWCAKKIEYVTKGHGLLGLAILVIPILFGGSIILTILYHMFGPIGYYVVSLGLLWYCIDANDPVRQSTASGVALLESNYQNLYARLFWFAVFGPVALLFYYILDYFNTYFVTHQDDEAKELVVYTQRVLGVFDWIPVRLFTFSFALVGHFPAVFKEWIKLMVAGLDSKTKLIQQCASPVVTSKEDAVSLLNRVLIVWLVVIALVTLGIMLG